MPDEDEELDTTGGGDIVPTGTVDDDGDLEISLEDDEAESESEESDEERKSRKERRAERYDEMKRQKEEAERERQEYERMVREEREHRIRLEQQMQEFDRRTRPQEPDRYDEALKRLREEEESLYDEHRRYGAQWDAETAEKKRKRAYELQETREQLIVRRELQRHQPEQSQQVHPTIMMLKANYPDVYTNERAYVWAESRVRQQMAEGKQVTADLLKDSLEEARKRFRTSGATTHERRSEPSEATRQRFAGSPKGGSGGDNGRRGTAKISKADRIMAREMYPGIDAKKAYRLFYKNVLSKGS